jgi:hypothetical protein
MGGDGKENKMRSRCLRLPNLVVKLSVELGYVFVS